MNKADKILRYVFPIVLLIGGIMFTITGISKLIAVAQYPTATAIITDVEIEEGVGDESDSYTYFVKYSVEGTNYEGELDSNKMSYEVGKTVTIRYNPENPEKITSMSAGTAIFVTAFGALLLFVGIGIGATVLRERKAAALKED